MAPSGNPTRNRRIGIALASVWALVAIAFVWWRSVPHFGGTLRVTRGGRVESFNAKSCSAGTAKKPHVYGTKLSFDGPFAVLVDGSSKQEDGPFVVVRDLNSDSKSRILNASQCTTIRTHHEFYEPHLLNDGSWHADGSASFDCTLPDGTRLEADLTFKRCVKSPTAMIGEVD